MHRKQMEITGSSKDLWLMQKNCWLCNSYKQNAGDQVKPSYPREFTGMFGGQTLWSICIPCKVFSYALVKVTWFCSFMEVMGQSAYGSGY